MLNKTYFIHLAKLKYHTLPNEKFSLTIVSVAAQ